MGRSSSLSSLHSPPMLQPATLESLMLEIGSIRIMAGTSLLDLLDHHSRSLFKVCCEKPNQQILLLNLKLLYIGTAISWYSSKDPKGGVADVFVDSDGPSVIDASAGTSVNDNPVTVVMFTKSNLDPSQEHTINVSYVGPGALGGPYVTIYLLA